MITSLVSSGGRRGALVEILKHSPQSTEPNRVVVVDASKLSAAGRLADVYRIVPRVDSPDFISSVLSIASETATEVVIPTIDPEIAVYAKHKDEFCRAGVNVWVSSCAVAELGWDKWLLFNWLRNHGFPTVNTEEATGLATSSLSGPVVSKPRSGSASIGVQFAKSVAALHRDDIGPGYIVQEQAPGIELTVDFAVSNRGDVLGLIPRRRLEVRAGEVSKAVTVHIPLVEQLVRDLVSSLEGAYGVLNAQIFYDPEYQRVNIIELNPRFGGGYPLSHNAGADLITALYRSDSGVKQEVTWQPGHVMLRYDTAAFFDSAGYRDNPWA